MNSDGRLCHGRGKPAQLSLAIALPFLLWPDFPAYILYGVWVIFHPITISFTITYRSEIFSTEFSGYLIFETSASTKGRAVGCVTGAYRAAFARALIGDDCACEGRRWK